MGENFKLKWNDHHSIFFSTAEELCMEDNLTDITLSCGKQEFSAHKLVLSICSTYFKDLFAPRQNQKGNSKYLHRPASQAAIVYLKDVKPSHMELLLNFMYRGEIHVQEEELMDLLTTAKGLQIRGLSESELGEEESNHPSTIPKNKTAEASSPLKTKKNKAVKRPSKESQQPSTSKKIKEESVCESPDLSTENLATDDFAPDDHDPMEENQPEEDLTNFQEENVDEMSYDQTDLVQPEVQIWTSKAGNASCPFCPGKTFANKGNLKRHMLIHTGERPHKCPNCDLGFTENSKLKRHIKTCIGDSKLNLPQSKG